MTTEQIEAFLAQAFPGQPLPGQSGLDAGAVGDAERLLLPEPQVDEARTSRPGVAIVPPALLHVRSDALEAAGIEAGFDEDTRALVLTASAHLAFGLAEPGQLRTSGDAGGTRFQVPTDRAHAFGVWSAAGPLAIGSVGPRAIELRVVNAWPAPPLPASVVIANWSRWHATMAAGRVARGFEPDATEADAIPARRWLRSVTADQRALIERFAIVRLHAIESQLLRLQEGLGVDQQLDFAWQSLCWHRDDVEGLRVLLREAGAGQTLATAVRGVDDIGRAVRFSWPSDIDVHDERLQRVSEADPGAWWGSTRRQVVWL
ncbi:MAG: hypothetical protein ABIT71_13295 [Vicinamibacteraceae bacterium]